MITIPEIKKTLLDLRARQNAGEQMLCPRCGLDTMSAKVTRNALSRYADIYVCDDCGTTEAYLDMIQNPLPLEQWAVFNASAARDEFAALTLEEVKQRVTEEQADTLIALFKDWSDKDKTGPVDFESVRKRAFAACPGLWSLTETPFCARYKALSGYVTVQLRRTLSDRVQIAISAIAVHSDPK